MTRLFKYGVCLATVSSTIIPLELSHLITMMMLSPMLSYAVEALYLCSSQLSSKSTFFGPIQPSSIVASEPKKVPRIVEIIENREVTSLLFRRKLPLTHH
jgi:hypothetical protein